TSSTSIFLRLSPVTQPVMTTHPPPKSQNEPKQSRRGQKPRNRTAPRPKQTNGEATGATLNLGSGASPVGLSEPKKEVVPIPILILGAQGCGKSSLINAAFGKPVREISNGFDLGTKDFHPDTMSDGRHKFTLVDSPGFDNASMNDTEVMTKLVHFLCCGKTPAKVAGVIYVHTQDTRLGSGVLMRNLHLIKSLLGDSFMDRLTILLVPRPGEQTNHQELIRPLLDPKSPFYPLYESGALFDVSALETKTIRNILLSYAGKAPALLSVQNELCRNGRMPSGNNINTYLMKRAWDRESGSLATGPKTTATGLPRTPASSSNQHDSNEIDKLQLQLAESKKQAEGLSTQLQQHLDQCAALRPQPLIDEDLEKSHVVQSLIDLNCRIEYLGRSLSEHLVKTYGENITTTQDVFQLPELKGLFGHEEGKASLVLSSRGVGMPLKDFLGFAVRSILCEQVYKRILAPFHPGLEVSDARNKHVLAIYGRIREKESQVTLGRWRTASFTAISGLVGERELSYLKAKVGLDIIYDNLIPMLQHVFGPNKNARPTDAHTKELSELTAQAWDWCAMAKGKIDLPGDFQPTAYRYGAAFDPVLMSEFGPLPGSQPPNRILSTVALGLNVFRGGSSGEGSDRVVLRNASVITEGVFKEL
ncbi:unnamed protein product, partial [Rhizoctonia solani]